MAVAVDEEVDEENNGRMDRDMKVLVNCVDQEAWVLGVEGAKNDVKRPGRP